MSTYLCGPTREAVDAKYQELQQSDVICPYEIDINLITHSDAVYFCTGWQNCYDCILVMVVACKYKKKLVFEDYVDFERATIELRIVPVEDGS